MLKKFMKIATENGYSAKIKIFSNVNYAREDIYRNGYFAKIYNTNDENESTKIEIESIDSLLTSLKENGWSGSIYVHI